MAFLPVLPKTKEKKRRRNKLVYVGPRSRGFLPGSHSHVPLELVTTSSLLKYGTGYKKSTSTKCVNKEPL